MSKILKMNKKEKIYFTIGSCFSIIGAVFLAFLYFYPYHPVEYYFYKDNATNISAKINDLEVTKFEPLEEFSSEIESILLDDEDSYNKASTALNINVPKEFNSSFYTKSSILVVSFKGTIMSNSKINKLKLKNNELSLAFSIENDFILDGSSTSNDSVYNYYFIPVQTKNITKINFAIKKV